jgi:lipopolysaccharide transport system permease protein
VTSDVHPYYPMLSNGSVLRSLKVRCWEQRMSFMPQPRTSLRWLMLMLTKSSQLLDVDIARRRGASRPAERLERYVVSSRRKPGPVRRHWRNRELIIASTKRDIMNPYAGQVLGAYWVFVQPLFFVALLTVVFNFVFGARFSGGTAERDYTTFILAGLVPWQVFSVLLGRASSEVLGAANLVKQVVFPIETLPVKSVLAMLPPLIIGFVFIVGYQLVAFGNVPWTIALLPLLSLVQAVWMIGCATLLSSIAVFFRDTKDFVNMFVTASVYLLPIVYLPGNIPGPIKPIVTLNPFSSLIYAYQDALYFGRIAHPEAWVGIAILAPLTFYVGHGVFSRLRPHMGNVL